MNSLLVVSFNACNKRDILISNNNTQLPKASYARMATEDIGLSANGRKCAVAHVKQGKLERSDESTIREEDLISIPGSSGEC